MSRRDLHNPDSLYTRDPSLRFHMSGAIEPLEYGEGWSWEHYAVTALIMGAAVLIGWSLFV